MIRIIELLNGNGQFMNEQEIRQKYNSNTNFLTLQDLSQHYQVTGNGLYCKILHDIFFIKSNVNGKLYLQTIDTNFIFTKVTTRELYWHFLSKTKTTPLYFKMSKVNLYF